MKTTEEWCEEELERVTAERDRLREALETCLADLLWAQKTYGTGNEFAQGIDESRAALQGDNDE